MKNSPMIRIILVNADGTSSRDVASLIENSSRHMLVSIKPSEIAKEVTETGTDLVIVDLARLEDAEKEILNAIRGQAPELPLIVVSEALSPEATRQLFKFNVQDWLNKPLDKDELFGTIRNVVRTSRSNNNRVHAVVSCVGGAGATTAAVSMAEIAARMFRKKKSNIALFDLDFSTGDCSYVLNMVNSFNLSTVASTPRRIDSEFISVIQQKHAAGFYLYSFKRPELNTDLNGYELVLRLLDAVSLEHDHTFLDIPYYETEWKDDVFSAVNTCTLVSELNLPAIKHTLDTLQRIRALRGDKFIIRVIFNKRPGSLFGQRVSKRKLKELFGETPIFYLPVDNRLIGQSVDRGVLPAEIARRSPFIKSLTKYMKSIELTEEVEK